MTYNVIGCSLCHMPCFRRPGHIYVIYYYSIIVSLVDTFLCYHFLYSPSPTSVDRERYTLTVIIDGETVTELGGSYCGSCYFDVSNDTHTVCLWDICFYFSYSTVMTGHQWLSMFFLMLALQVCAAVVGVPIIGVSCSDIVNVVYVWIACSLWLHFYKQAFHAH